MPSILPIPSSATIDPDGEPDIFGLMDDVKAAAADRYEKTVASMTELNGLTGMFTDQIMWVAGTVQRFYVYTGSGTGYGWQPLDNMVHDATYGWIPRSINGSNIVSGIVAGASGTTLALGKTVVGGEKYMFVLTNGDTTANSVNVIGTRGTTTGSVTSVVFDYNNGSAGSARINWKADYAQ